MFTTEQFTIPTWARALAVIVGLIAIILAVTFLIFPSIALGIFVFLVAIFLIAFGIERIAAGASGRSTRWVVKGSPQGAPPSTGSPPVAP